MRRLSSFDTQFLAAEDGRTHTHVVQLTVVEGTTYDGRPVTLETVRSVIAERIHLLPLFTMTLRTVPFDLDYPVLVEDPAFDLDDHLWEMALPSPGTDEQLGDLVARVASRPLDRGRPLWEVYVVRDLAEGRVAVLTKISHALVDGVSGLELLSTLLDVAPEGRDVEPPDQPRELPAPPSDLSLLARGVASLPRQQVRMLSALPATLRHLDQLPTMRTLPGTGPLTRAADAVYGLITRDRDGAILERPTGPGPEVSFGGRISAHRRFAFGTLDLDTVKAVKDTKPGLTVNDVVVAVTAGAVRRRLLARGDSVTEPLVAYVPISVRTPGTGFGNHIASLIAEIPTDEPDPVARLERSHATMQSAKTRHRATPATLLTDANHTVPPALFGRVARAISFTAANGLIDPAFNLTVSNLPGSRIPLHLAGARVVSQHPVNLVFNGHGLAVTLLSYQDRLDFGLTVDRDNFPDVWHLAADLEAALAELAEAVGVPTRRTRRAPRRRR
ncbi:wax ester/triacylglycerol synthase family O-acyltransferase [Nocardioides aestuarii]|uniref:Diacylglycerol O-acyltransferase n=1 Tax=Nocardioides aestuarii TaxID=252231 RepID=A0ABW4TQU7_9ACTN